MSEEQTQETESTEEITLALVSVKSPAILVADNVLPTENKPRF